MIVDMRSSYREDLDDFAHDVITMCDRVRDVMAKASEALLRGSLQPAEEALSMQDDLDEIRGLCEQRAVDLLALESPRAGDLRQVISSMHIVHSLDRMGALAIHIADAARRRHPDRVVPSALVGEVEELSGLVQAMVEQIHDLLVAPDADTAVTLAEEDEAVDEIHDRLMAILTQRDWEHSTREAVDLALLCRYYERYADQCVNVATSIVYLTSGLRPEEYLATRERDSVESDVQARFEELERQAVSPRHHPGIDR